jgi:hypothetical protein
MKHQTLFLSYRVAEGCKHLEDVSPPSPTTASRYIKDGATCGSPSGTAIEGSEKEKERRER